jgi:hypothetical protein
LALFTKKAGKARRRRETRKTTDVSSLVTMMAIDSKKIGNSYTKHGVFILEQDEEICEALHGLCAGPLVLAR